jgi:hypothetical protein
MPANVLEMLIKAGEAEWTRGAHRHVGVPRYFPRGCRYYTIEELLLPPDEQPVRNYHTGCHCFCLLSQTHENQAGYLDSVSLTARKNGNDHFLKHTQKNWHPIIENRAILHMIL